jgi:hypothetical protein
MKRSLLAGFTILVAWMLVDLLIHRIFLAPFYEATTNLPMKTPIKTSVAV